MRRWSLQQWALWGWLMVALVGGLFAANPLTKTSALAAEDVTWTISDHDYLQVTQGKATYWVTTAYAPGEVNGEETLTRVLRMQDSGQLRLSDRPSPQATSITIHAVDLAKQTVDICGQRYRLQTGAVPRSKRLNVTALFRAKPQVATLTLMAADWHQFQDQCGRHYSVRDQVLPASQVKRALGPVKWHHQRVYALTYDLKTHQVLKINQRMDRTETATNTVYFGGVYLMKTGQYAVQLNGHYYLLAEEKAAE